MKVKLFSVIITITCSCLVSVCLAQVENKSATPLPSLEGVWVLDSDKVVIKQIMAEGDTLILSYDADKYANPIDNVFPLLNIKNNQFVMQNNDTEFALNYNINDDNMIVLHNPPFIIEFKYAVQSGNTLSLFREYRRYDSEILNETTILVYLLYTKK